MEKAEEEDRGADEDDLEDRIVAEMKKRGLLKNVSHFAFTATPKPKTMELFGAKRDDGTFAPFSLYSMRQAIEENFILDVLQNYTTYKTYWNLLKKVENDPHYEKEKANYLLKQFVDLHPNSIEKKITIMVEHFSGQVKDRIGGKAKAMIVTRSRLHAVRYRLALDKYLKSHNYPFRALVAFSGEVRDGGMEYTEANLNGFSEKQTAEMFKREEYRFLVVAAKFQTGFDQPLLHTMYVDKKLGGVNAVQTLSRLNRVYPGKEETAVLDFANDADEIQKAFEPYFDRTILTETTDPNLLYNLETRLEEFQFYAIEDVNRFAAVYFAPKSTLDKIYSALAPVVARYEAAPEEERVDFRGTLQDYVRLYAFLSQILPFSDAGLEKLYVFGRLLLRKLPVKREKLPVEIQQQIDLESQRIYKTRTGTISLQRQEGKLEPIHAKANHRPLPDEIEPLSRIIKELNERFGTSFLPEDRVFIEQLEAKLADDTALKASVRVNPPESARLTFDHVVTDKLQDMIDTNFKFYKQVTDNEEFGKMFIDWLFDRFRQRQE